MTIEKRITGWGVVEVPAGAFNAYRVEWIYPGPVVASIIDDIASVGLIRRQITVPFVVTGHNHPEEPIAHIAYDLMELDSLMLR